MADEHALAIGRAAVECNAKSGDGEINRAATEPAIKLRERVKHGGTIGLGETCQVFPIPMQVPRRIQDKEICGPADGAQERVEFRHVGRDEIG